MERSLTTILPFPCSNFKKEKKTQQILGMGIHHDKDRNITYMTQQQYIEASVKVFAKYGINEFQTPMEDRVQFSKSQQPKPGSPKALQSEHIHTVN